MVSREKKSCKRNNGWESYNHCILQYILSSFWQNHRVECKSEVVFLLKSEILIKSSHKHWDQTGQKKEKKKKDLFVYWNISTNIGNLEWTTSWPIIVKKLSCSFRNGQTPAWVSFRYFGNYLLLRGKNILGHKEATTPCAVSSSLKHFKKWGSAPSLKLMSRSKHPDFLPESLGAVWQLFYESWLVFIFLFAQTAKTASLSLADILFLNRGPRILFQ